MARPSQDDKNKQIAVVIVVVLVLGFVFKSKLFPAKTGKDNVRGGGGVAAAPGAPAGGDAGAGGPGAPAVTPSMIPTLSPEIKRKIKDRRSFVEQYSKEKLEAGTNPFVQLGVNVDDESKTNSGPGAGFVKKKGGKVVFSKKLTFWGAFLPGPDEPKRVIIEVQGDPQPWTGQVGEMIEGTPYRVEALTNGDLNVVLKNPTNPNDKTVTLVFEGSKDGEGGGRGSGSSDKEVDELFGGKTAAEPAAKGGKGSLEPAFDR